MVKFRLITGFYTKVFLRQSKIIIIIIITCPLVEQHLKVCVCVCVCGGGGVQSRRLMLLLLNNKNFGREGGGHIY